MTEQGCNLVRRFSQGLFPSTVRLEAYAWHKFVSQCWYVCLCVQMCATNGPPLPLDAQLYWLPQLSLLCAVYHLPMGGISVLGKQHSNSMACMHGITLLPPVV